MSTSPRTMVEKTLSANDVADTGSHQAGILIPRKGEILGILPLLDEDSKNPRAVIAAFDEDGRAWRLTLIHYNNRFHGGTRNEYRLTGIGPYLRQKTARMGDVFQLERREREAFRIGLVSRLGETDTEAPEDGGIVRLQLTNTWRIVKW